MAAGKQGRALRQPVLTEGNKSPDYLSSKARV
jgi:hypothetical protein